MTVWISAKFQILYASVCATYPNNFIKTIYMVQQMIKQFTVHLSSVQLCCTLNNLWSRRMNQTAQSGE